jgi:uncharacterized protein
MRTLAVRLALFLAAMTLTAGAHAASFNCAKAKTSDEKAICASRSLSELDVKMATLWGVRMQVPMLMGSRGAAQDEQHQFLIDRGTCGASTTCIRSVYQTRIDALNAEISAAMQDYCVKMGICG